MVPVAAHAYPAPVKIPSPYRQAAPKARWIKALIQMAIGVVATGITLRDVKLGWNHHETALQIGGHVLDAVGTALAIAAAVELAYTLFTHGPDEALDPVMLGLSATLLLALGHVDKLDWRSGLAALLYVTALGGLFGIRKHLADIPDEDEQPASTERDGVRPRLSSDSDGDSDRNPLIRQPL